MAIIKTKQTPVPKLVKIYKHINSKKELILDKKDIEALMNALDHYKDSQPFKLEYKEYLSELRNFILMLGEW